ncbi:hypothetical protein WR25_00662 [Diploscapter pachys]|uniref:Uncharacterized protein n=1 Tax=Diploscapter pachys TaxID=2018661 RepID=A0A2A2JJ14_9BILA|nr:hypothetical protein WR25_00662 [Diploscapter pachys]
MLASGRLKMMNIVVQNTIGSTNRHTCTRNYPSSDRNLVVHFRKLNIHKECRTQPRELEDAVPRSLADTHRTFSRLRRVDIF